MRVLILEDNANLMRDLSEQMSRSGFLCDCAASLREAEEIAGDHEYDLALIDRRLPDGDGISFVRDLRGNQLDVCILILTALDDAREIVISLDAGADDYLTKPFEPDELMARVRALLRRATRSSLPSMTLGKLSFDPRSRDFGVREKPIVLQRREALLLEALVRRAGRVVMREALTEEIWSEKEDLTTHNLNALVSQLRVRLKEMDAKVEIHAARGLGFFIAEEKA